MHGRVNEQKNVLCSLVWWRIYIFFHLSLFLFCSRIKHKQDIDVWRRIGYVCLCIFFFWYRDSLWVPLWQQTLSWFTGVIVYNVAINRHKVFVFLDHFISQPVLIHELFSTFSKNFIDFCTTKKSIKYGWICLMPIIIELSISYHVVSSCFLCIYEELRGAGVKLSVICTSTKNL